MTEEKIVDVFGAHLLMIEEGDVKRSCTFFVTDKRLVVLVPEGINPWIGVVAAVAFVAGLAGLLLRNLILFLGGLGAGFVLVLLLVLVDFAIRYRKRSKVRQLAPDEILRAYRRNFEIPYSEITRVKHEPVERIETAGYNRILLPSLPYTTHLVRFETGKGKYVFMIERGDIARFLDLMNRFVPGKIEENQT
jgi:hypothetical protein